MLQEAAYLMDETEIRSMTIEEAFEVFTSEDEELQEKDVYLQARFGTELQFDLYSWIKQLYSIKEKTGKITIEGKTYKMRDFWTEIENRNRILKKWLLENFVKEELVKPRERKK